MTTDRYFPIFGDTLAAALAAFRATSCQCVRRSFAGVRYTADGGEETRISWAMLDTIPTNRETDPPLI